MKPDKHLFNSNNHKVLKIPDDQRRNILKINSLCQIKGIEDLKDLKGIDLSHNNISDLECWEKLEGFEEINLSFNHISDISPLQNLKHMKTLYINGNNIDFSQIERFTEKRPDVKFNIDHVVVSDKCFYYESRINHNLFKDIAFPGIDVGRVYRLEDIGGLGNYDNLHGLRIIELYTFDGIEKLTNLKALIIQDGHFSEIKGFEGFKNLELLVLEQPYEVCDLKPLKYLNNLRFLFLGGTMECVGTLIEKIEGLENMTKLKLLTMPFCCVEKIQGLENLRSLETLELFENYISKIEGLENLEKLNYLDVRANQISKIEGLENLQKLKDLNLSYNKISKIEDLTNLKKLKTLNLDGNKISKIEGLENLENLKILSLSNNHISKIEGLENLQNLKELYLNRNEISKIEGLENLSNLERLHLYGNELSNVYNKSSDFSSYLHPSVDIKKFKGSRAKFSDLKIKF